MKKIILFILLLVLSSAVFSQTSTYYRRYNIPGMQGGLGIVETDDGGFVGIGQHEGNGSSGDCDIYAYKVDACGNLQWMKLIGTAAQEGGKSIYKRSNGNLLLAGLYNNSGFLIELDFNGNLIWERRFSGLSWTLSVTEDTAGDIYVTGTYGVGEYRVVKCNNTGNVIWSKSYAGLGVEPHSIISISPNKLLVFSTFDVPNGDFALNCIDGNGNILWSKAYGGSGYSSLDHNPWGGKAILDQSGVNAYVVSQSALNGSDNILLSKIDLNNGNIWWSNIIGDGGSDQPRDLVRTYNGVAVLGNTNGYNTPANPSLGINAPMNERDVLLVKLDGSGNKLWAHTYGAEERDKGIGLRHNDDGTFLISAYTSSSYFGNTDASMDPLFIRTDSLGLVSCQVNTPNISVQGIQINSYSTGTCNVTNVTDFVSNSNVIDYLPSDDYQCLSCSTVPLFVPSDTIVCVNESIYFYNTTSVGLKCFQSWYLDGVLLDGSLDTISYTFTQPGDYPVLLFSNCGASTDTFRIVIHVDPIPNVQFTVSNNCINDTTRFFNISTISSGTVISYYWDFKDNIIDSTNFNASHFYATYGTYNATLSAISDLGCSNSITNPVTIMPLPTAIFTNTVVCPGQSTEFSDQSLPGSGNTLSTWIWNFGDNSAILNGGQTESHIYNTPNTYNATLTTITSNGCKDDTTISVLVKDKPIADFNTIGPFCVGDGFATSNLSTTPSNTNMSFYWDLGNGVSSTLPNPTVILPVSGLQPIELFTYASNGCLDSITKFIFINPNPIPNIISGIPCVETNIQLYGNSLSSQTITNWFWNLGSGVTSNQQNIIDSYSKGGVYYPYLQITDVNGCKADTSIQYTVYDNPIATFQFVNKCDGESLTFNDISTSSIGDTLNSWSWEFGDGLASINSSPSIIHTYSTYGDYLVNLYVTSQHGCKDTISNLISVYPNPIVNFISDTVCYLKSTSFTNLSSIPKGNISSWLWNFGDNKFSNLLSPSHIYNSPGNKSVNLIATSDFGCIDSLRKGAVVWNLPHPQIQILDSAICQNFDVKFFDNSFSQDGFINSWYWDFGNGDISLSQNPKSFYCNPGVYNISLAVTTNLGCQNDTSYNSSVVIYPLPVADFIYNPMNASVYMPDIYFYDKSIYAANWFWDFGDLSNSNLKDPEHRFDIAGIYKVTLIVESEFGCLDTTFKYIEVKDDYALWIPNSFSPNNDGVNDYFYVKGFGVTDIKLSVFNRWGDQVFQSFNEITGWDGIYNNANAPEDVYIYQISYKDVFGDYHESNGRVNLVR